MLAGSATGIIGTPSLAAIGEPPMSGTGGTALNAVTRGKDRDMVTVSS